MFTWFTSYPLQAVLNVTLLLRPLLTLLLKIEPHLLYLVSILAFWSSFIFSTFPFARSTQHLPTYSVILSWLGLIPLHTFQLGETRVLVLPLPHGWQSQSPRPTARISVTSLFPWAGVQMSSNLFSEFKFHPVSPCTCFQKPFSASVVHPYFPSLICPHVRLEAAG